MSRNGTRIALYEFNLDNEKPCHERKWGGDTFEISPEVSMCCIVEVIIVNDSTFDLVLSLNKKKKRASSMWLATWNM